MKGKLVIIGGAEDKGTKDDKAMDDFTEDGILKRIVDESAHQAQSRIEVVTTASMVPDDIGNDYLKAFAKLSAKNVGLLKMQFRGDASEKANLDRLAKADVVFFTGGNQMRLTSLLGGSPFLDLMKKKLKDGNFIYAGTSAGAAAASDSMIFQGQPSKALLKGEVQVSAGFGLVDDVVFDTHFVNRGRIGRLFQIVVANPSLLGIGLEENSGLLITGSKMESIGPGMTIVIDGQHIRNSNLLEVREGVPLSIDNLTLHVMSKFDTYDMKTRQLTILTPEDCKL
jgi:cyanophycinase